MRWSSNYYVVIIQWLCDDQPMIMWWSSADYVMIIQWLCDGHSMRRSFDDHVMINRRNVVVIWWLIRLLVDNHIMMVQWPRDDFPMIKRRSLNDHGMINRRVYYDYMIINRTNSRWACHGRSSCDDRSSSVIMWWVCSDHAMILLRLIWWSCDAHMISRWLCDDHSMLIMIISRWFCNNYMIIC